MKFSFIIDDGIFERLYRITWRGLQLVHVEVNDPENAARIFRRTMKPWALLTGPIGDGPYEAVCFPFVDDGVVKINVRAKVNDPCLLLTLECAGLRPIQFSPRRTGVPANDPLPVQLGRPA